MSREFKYVPALRPIRPIRPEGQMHGRANYNRNTYPNSTSRYPAQEKMIAFIEKQLEGFSCPPSLEEIRRHMGWQNATSVRQCLEKIAERGALPAGFDRSAMATTRKPYGRRRAGA